MRDYSITKLKLRKGLRRPGRTDTVNLTPRKVVIIFALCRSGPLWISDVTTRSFGLTFQVSRIIERPVPNTLLFFKASVAFGTPICYPRVALQIMSTNSFCKIIRTDIFLLLTFFITSLLSFSEINASSFMSGVHAHYCFRRLAFTKKTTCVYVRFSDLFTSHVPKFKANALLSHQGSETCAI